MNHPGLLSSNLMLPAERRRFSTSGSKWSISLELGDLSKEKGKRKSGEKGVIEMEAEIDRN